MRKRENYLAMPRVRRFIIQQRAWYIRAEEIVGEVVDKFGLTISVTEVLELVPEVHELNGAIDPLTPEERAGMNALRERYLKSIEAIPIAQQSWRLRQMNEMYFQAVKVREKLDILRQAAQELGGSFVTANVTAVQVNHYQQIADDPEKRFARMQQLISEIGGDRREEQVPALTAGDDDDC